MPGIEKIGGSLINSLEADGCQSPRNSGLHCNPQTGKENHGGLNQIARKAPTSSNEATGIQSITRENPTDRDRSCRGLLGRTMSQDWHLAMKAGKKTVKSV